MLGKKLKEKGRDLRLKTVSGRYVTEASDNGKESHSASVQEMPFDQNSNLHSAPKKCLSLKVPMQGRERSSEAKMWREIELASVTVKVSSDL
jgi:hypothetical protein